MKKRSRGHMWQTVKEAEDRLLAALEPVARDADPYVGSLRRNGRAKRHTGTNALIAALRKEDPARSHLVRRYRQATKADLIAEVGTACEDCGFTMPDPSLLHMHHVIPVSRGGDNSPSNLKLLCPNCHALAHHKLRAEAS